MISLTGRKVDYLSGRTSFTQKPYPGIQETVLLGRLWGVLGFLAYRLNVPFFWQSLLLYLYLPKEVRAQSDHADLVIFDFPYLVTAKKHFKGKPTLLNTHNIESELWPQKIWKFLVNKYEHWSFGQTDFITFCTTREKDQVIQALGPTIKAGVIPNGLNVNDLEKYRSVHEREKFRQLIDASPEHLVCVFSGSNFGPNVEAFEFLSEFCLKHQQRLLQNKIKILVVGSVGKTPTKNTVLTVTSRVEDVYPYLVASDVALNLVTSGSGSNVKNFEYIFFRLPLVTTVMGARGIRGTPDPVFITNGDDLLEILLAIRSKNRSDLAEKTYALNRDLIEMEQAVLNTLQHLPMFN